MHPPTCGEAAVPAQQRVGGDDEPAQHPARQEPGKSGEERAVGFGELGAWHMAVQHGDLVAQRDGFDFEGAARLGADHEEVNDGDEEPVEDRTDTRAGTTVGGGGRHRRTVSATRPSWQPAGAVHRLRWRSRTPRSQPTIGFPPLTNLQSGTFKLEMCLTCRAWLGWSALLEIVASHGQ